MINTVLSNGMIMQRDAAFPIWSRQKVTVTFWGKKYEARSADNKWLVILDPVPAGGPFTMDIVWEEGPSAGRSATIQDIYSGDVWLAAGQSNMETPMQRLADDFPEEWEYDYPLIRQFKVPQEWDFSGPREELTGGSWIASSAETLHEFSGTAWFFARNLYEKYRVPIGIVHTAWGGTPIEAWMSRDALAGFPARIAEGDQFADTAKCKKITDKTDAAIKEWESRLLREDRGLGEEWQKPSTDISGWKELTLPGDFADAGLPRFCGAIWLARDFDVSLGFTNQGAKVWLGTIVDADTVYINGAEAGNTTYRYPPRKYPIPAGMLKEGKNRIVIRVTCMRDIEGGITRDKPFRIFTDNETIELAGTWKYRIGVTASPRPEEFFFHL
jgi:sialate O-acetylesterase